jgi:hypothetical protein
VCVSSLRCASMTDRRDCMTCTACVGGMLCTMCVLGATSYSLEGCCPTATNMQI